MRYLFIIILTFLITSCTHSIKITKGDYKDSNESFHKVHATKVIKRADSHKPKREKMNKELKKYNDRISKYNARHKDSHSKRLANSTFNFH